VLVQLDDDDDEDCDDDDESESESESESDEDFDEDGLTTDEPHCLLVPGAGSLRALFNELIEFSCTGSTLEPPLAGIPLTGVTLAGLG
jgi:hypothetical protein